jgi:hypothetical protein
MLDFTVPQAGLASHWPSIQKANDVARWLQEKGIAAFVLNIASWKNGRITGWKPKDLPGRQYDKGGRGTLTRKHRSRCVLPLCHDPVFLREEFKQRRIVFVAGVRLHRLRGLRALTAEAQVELTDEFDVSAVLTSQNDAFQYLADRVHDSSLLSCSRLGRVRADGCDVATPTTQGEYTIV